MINMYLLLHLLYYQEGIQFPSLNVFKFTFCFHMYSIARECLEKLSSNKDNLLWTTTNRTKLLEGAKAWKLDFLFYSKKSVGKLDCSGSGWYLWPCNRGFFYGIIKSSFKNNTDSSKCEDRLLYHSFSKIWS